MRIRRSGLAGLLLVTAGMSLAYPGALHAQQACNCPPGTSHAPYQAPSKGTVPGMPPSTLDEQLAAAPAFDLGEAAPAQLGQSFAMAAPNMVGDFFGGTTGSGGFQIIDSIIVGSQDIQGLVPTSGSGAPYSLTNPPGGSGGRGIFVGNTYTTLNSDPATFSTVISAGEFRTLLNQNTLNGDPTPSPHIRNNGGYQALANSQFQSRNSTAGNTVFRGGDSYISGTVSASSGSPVQDSDTMNVDAYYAYDYVVELNLPGPGTGGVVGIQKLVENGSPIPRDRLIFNYSMFQNVRFTPGGIDVNRFVVGFEKTFLDETWSLELRAPFASTLSTDQVLGSGAAMNTQFGNLTLYAKTLLTSGDTYVVGAGMGVALPTGDDVTLRDQSGDTLLQINNEAVQLLPYVGGIWAPNDRFYTQAIGQVNVVTSGNPLLANTGNSLTQVGSLNDPTWLFASINAGYWTYRASPSQRLSGVSPLVELHYNKTLNDADQVTAGAFRIGNGATNIEMINAVAGVNFEMYGTSYLSVAYVAPLTTGSDRFFDGELRVLFNRYWW